MTKKWLKYLSQDPEDGEGQKESGGEGQAVEGEEDAEGEVAGYGVNVEQGAVEDNGQYGGQYDS